MKKRIFSILLCLCMVLMLVPITVFAANLKITMNFKYGNLVGMPQAENPYIFVVEEGHESRLPEVENCAPYELVGWKEAGSGTVYAPKTNFLMGTDLTFDAVYQVQGSLAVTVDGFEVGNTLADCTYSFESTIPGITFSEDDIQSFSWEKYVFVEEQANYDWFTMYETEAFEAGVIYRIWMNLDNKGLELAPAVTVNGNTPEDCLIATSAGVPIQLHLSCTLGTPALTLTIDGPDVVCAQQDYEFTVTPPAGVTLEESFGYDTGMKSGSADLDIDDDGVGHGVVSVEWYDLQTNRFTLTASGRDLSGDTVPGSKTVEVSPEHIYENGVCGCGAVQQYTVTYDGGEGSDPVTDTKTHGEDLTLRGETFTMDGFVQTDWVDKETGAAYRLGDTYTENADVTLNPVFEKIITLTVPYTTTVALGDVGEPGETTFELALIDGSGEALTADNVTVAAAVTTDGAGDYSAAMTFTGTERTLWVMLSEGAFVRQVDNGEAGWTVDDTVWGVLMEEIPVAYAMGDDATASGYTVYVVPASIDGNGYYYIDWENLQAADMAFTNTYTAHVYALNHDADGHWDECAGCEDKQNAEPHKYGDWKVIKAATQTAKGEKEHTCTICGYTEKAEIAKLPATDTTDTTKNNQNTGAATSPNTGDNSHMALWIALLFVSGAGVIGTTVYGKKKRVK